MERKKTKSSCDKNLIKILIVKKWESKRNETIIITKKKRSVEFFSNLSNVFILICIFIQKTKQVLFIRLKFKIKNFQVYLQIALALKQNSSFGNYETMKVINRARKLYFRV